MNLAESSTANDEAADFRKMLLDVLTDNPASVEVEKFYLAGYRRWLAELVGGSSTQSGAGGG